MRLGSLGPRFVSEHVACRQLPIVLPHERVETYVKEGFWPASMEPDYGKRRTQEFWKHCKEYASWAQSHHALEKGLHRPVCLYCDDAALSKVTGEKLTIFTMSDFLDPRKDCMATAWPLFFLREAG